MTHMELLMLAVCFGSAMGYTISNLVTIINFAIYEHKEKKRKKAEPVNNQASDN